MIIFQMGPIELINLEAGEMGQFLQHKNFAQTFPCSHPKRIYVSLIYCNIKTEGE